MKVFGSPTRQIYAEGLVMIENASSDYCMRPDKHYTYILRCNDGTLYTGYTNDLDKRVKAHNEGKGAKYTRSRSPVVLVYHEVFDTKKEAMSREWHIKHDMTRDEKIKLIESSANSLTDLGSEHRMEPSNANALNYFERRNESMADDKKIEATKTEEVKAPVEKKTRGRKPAAKKAAPAKKATAKKAPAKAAAKAPAKKTAAKKTVAKKPGRKPAKKLGKIILEIDGQQIDIKALEKKAAKLGGDVYVVANEKKIFDTEGKSVDLF